MTETEYRELTDRNIGIITEQQQEILRNSTVAIFGTGGLGGVAAELLCRCGIGRLKIADPERFEASNLNRQIFCFRSTLNEKKVDVTDRFLRDINPDVEIEKYESVTTRNIRQILKDVSVVMLCTDKISGILPVCRQAREDDIPLVESWAVHYANVRVFTRATLSLEELYNLPSVGRQMEDLSAEDIRQIDLAMVLSVSDVGDIGSLYGENAMNRIEQGINPTLAPFVWQNAVLAGIEVIKILLNWGKIALAPEWKVYDPLLHRIPGK